MAALLHMNKFQATLVKKKSYKNLCDFLRSALPNLFFFLMPARKKSLTSLQIETDGGLPPLLSVSLASMASDASSSTTSTTTLLTVQAGGNCIIFSPRKLFSPSQTFFSLGTVPIKTL